TKLPSSVRDGLKALVGKMKGRDKLRIQLMAYAGGGGLSASRARRISLSRALAVRSYMIESGLRSTRIDLRALGNKTSAAPVNRVDVMVGER
ncbi:MAG: OmpA family protein, partial [Rhodospirillales bacterium]|nr:OmpA family protein [Rhodospirillales bacterium]